MTSAQNLRQRLNGNSLIAVFSFLAFFSFSCDLLKPVQQTGADRTEESGEEDLLEPIQGSRVYDPVRGEWVEVKNMPAEPMETIEWKDVPENVSPPITSSGVYTETQPTGPLNKTNTYGSQFFATYNVAVLLPFLTDRYDQQTRAIDQNSTWAINFYGGVKMALEDLSREGVSLKLTTLDTRADPNQVSQLIRTNADLPQAHLIVGAYRQDNIRAVADFALRRGIPYVSPYSAATDLTSNNPNYIQVSPSLASHCEALMDHALKHFRPEQLILATTNDAAETERLRFFQEAYFKRAGSRNAEKIEELIVQSAAADFDDINLAPLVQMRDTVVFLIPSWNESFVYSVLRKLELAKEPEQEIVVYGMPQWMFFEYMDFEYYEKLKVHLSSNYFLDPLAPEVQFFKRRYYDLFGAVAPLETYLGYDVMLYFGRMLNKHGTKFQYLMDTESESGLHTFFNFEQITLPNTGGAEQPVVQRFENKYVNILRFQDYQFQLAN